MFTSSNNRFSATISHLKQRESLLLAICLSGAGGYLDAFTWVGHGHVFANAQSGNIVLLGIAIAGGEWLAAGRVLMPIAAFFFGVFAAYWVKTYGSRRDERFVGVLSLGSEAIVLFAISTLPSTFAHDPIVLVIAFVAAFQSSIFTKLEAWTYNSVMTTGNLRKATECLFKGLSERDPATLAEGGKFGLVCLAFCFGAAAGAIATDAFSNAATIGAAILIGCALLLQLRSNAAASS